MTTILAIVSLVLLLLLAPGLALLKLTGAWNDWRRLRVIMAAIGVGLSLYPVTFYSLRLFAPEFHLQAWMGWAFLLLSSTLAVTELRRWRFSLRRLDVWLVALLALIIIVSRIWLVYEQPYPAWTDSVHHTLLTGLTAETGQLPNSLQPSMNVPLTMYHLGLYALSGLVAQMLGTPAHTALLWTAQTLNALTVAGVFLVLDRYAGRAGAIAGVLVAGLLSFQPAFYANWGRFTQLSAQALVLIAWVMIVDTIQQWRQPKLAAVRGKLIAQATLAGMASAAVFLYHFRVSIFFVALLMPSVMYLWRQAHRARSLSSALLCTVLIGALALLFVMPAALPAAQTWFDLNRAAAETQLADTEQFKQNGNNYFAYDLNYFSSLAARPWMLVIAALATLYGLTRNDRIAWISFVWFLLLMAIGNLYLLRIPLLALTNMGAVLIMLYMPIALVVGAAVQRLVASVPAQWAHSVCQVGAVGTILLALMFMWVRAHDFEEYRYFVTDADVRAAAWLRENSSPNDRVVINTTFWLPTFPHGTDAGYWLPYLAGLDTNTGVMISNLGGVGVVREIVADSILAKKVEDDPTALSALYERGYRFLYIGARGNYDGGGFDPAKLRNTEQTIVVYEHDGVTILELLP